MTAPDPPPPVPTLRYMRLRALRPIDLFSSRAHNTDGDDLLDADELAAVLDHTELKIPRG